jgi:hypothetical protein
MEKPSLEQVKKHFENAKEVRQNNGVYNGIYELIGSIQYDKETKSYYSETTKIISDVLLWDKKSGYAEIISYKDETFTITKEFILDLHKEVIWPSVKAKIEKEFPSVFEVKATEMTVAEVEAKLGHPVEIVK